MQDEEDAMGAIVGASITYRLAFGPNAGRKALTLQTVPVRTEQRKKLERLCRYITRPAIAERRLSLAYNGNVVIVLKTLYDDGTTHVVRRRPHSAQWNSWGAWQHWYQNHGSTPRGFMACSHLTANCVKTLFLRNR